MKSYNIRIVIYSIMILLILLFFSNIVNADIWIYTSRNYTVWSNQSGWYDFMGISIIPNYDFIGCKLYKYGTGETPTKCYLKNLNNGTIDGTSFIGNSCQVSNNLTKGQKYWIGYSNDGSGTYTRAFADLSVSSPVGNMPFNSTLFYMSNSVQCHAGNCVNLTAFYLGGYSFNCSIACTPVWINATLTDWFNMSAYNCTINDLIQQNRSFQRYDNACNQTNLTVWEFKNNSCSYCGSSIDTMNLSICNKNFNTYINLTESEKKMIEYALFFIIFILLGVFVNSLFIALSGVPLLLISTTYLYNAVSKLDLALFWVFLVLGFFFIILGVTIFIINGQKDIKNKENGDFKYKDY